MDKRAVPLFSQMIATYPYPIQNGTRSVILRRWKSFAGDANAKIIMDEKEFFQREVEKNFGVL